ncbi:MAG: bifunctional response regulator/alkaline phosphatase family protein [Bacteroidales bacterium]|nr:bifunctional response regulator/alkaline phosphatase family protein [Bacteroidales bacterium]
MNKIKILWVDDEIELLKPHIIFLEGKGYDVTTTNNGSDALEIIAGQQFDIIFLDEQMPGISGIQTLEAIKEVRPNTPVVMITKSEEENLMENAIGSNIADYLIKPVNPNQILLCLKKNLENKKLVSERTSQTYQQAFRGIGMDLSNINNFAEWADNYKRLVNWELRLGTSTDPNMYEIFAMQKQEANNLFSKFIEKNYRDWLKPSSNDPQKPVMSHIALKEYVFPTLGEKTTFMILIDNMRYDQWKIIEKIISDYYRVDNEYLFSSILPTTTQYARNALFAGLMPSEIQKKYPQYWLNEEDEGTKNQYQEVLLGENLKHHGKSNIKYSYTKVLNLQAGKKLYETLPNLYNNDFNVIVYNFVDMLSHARTEMEIIKELADDDAAYRSLTESWFEHSALYDIICTLAAKKINIAITTDHGSIKVDNPIKIIGDKATNTNLRYKTGKNIDYNKKQAMEVKNPEELFLPKTNLTSTFAFAKGNDFFAYPNNYNYYANYYKNSFQHGGISMEEMIIPFILLSAK